MARGFTVATAVSLLLLPLPVHASTSGLMSSEADVQGQGLVTGQVAGAVLQNSTANGMLDVWLLKGRMRVYEETTAVSAAKIDLTPRQHTSMTVNLHEAVARNFTLHQDSRLLVLPTALSFRSNNSEGMRMTMAPPAPLDFNPRASTDGRWRMATDGTLALGRPPDGYDTAQGSFQLVVWGASFVLENETGEHLIETGAFDDPAGPAGSPVSRHVQREAVFEVDDGAITIARSLPFQLFVSSCHIGMTTGFLDVKHPLGTNPVNGQPLLDGSHSLQLSAPLVADADASKNGVTLAFPQPPTEAILDGRIVRAPNPGPGFTMLWLVALLAIPVGAGAYSQVQLHRRLRSLDGLVKTQ